MRNRDELLQLVPVAATPGMPQRAIAGGTTAGRGWLVLMLSVVLLTGCASVPREYPRPPSSAFPDHASTAIGAYFETAAAAHPGQSGFAILPDGSRRLPRGSP